ncbi:hypothetical protein GGS23DRAFT_131869 [Durotheca rogersii]|uniref:uncharacterized protein n=1 Tax=Durotheca rogersii TaxID=419775 RepID=UPI00221FD0C4|nr:uncharacterized protein GGS23DRAFT_131869 [Durotheca rogersii]KAI5861796.1 hypothetical protein GGS23DRAFT_131869 [Durotheca rogersii]
MTGNVEVYRVARYVHTYIHTYIHTYRPSFFDRKLGRPKKKKKYISYPRAPFSRFSLTTTAPRCDHAGGPVPVPLLAPHTHTHTCPAAQHPEIPRGDSRLAPFADESRARRSPWSGSRNRTGPPGSLSLSLSLSLCPSETRRRGPIGALCMSYLRCRSQAAAAAASRSSVAFAALLTAVVVRFVRPPARDGEAGLAPPPAAPCMHARAAS